MEIAIELIPVGAVTLLFIGGLIAVNKEVAKRPTFKEIEDKYTEQNLCAEIHKNVDEKLNCIPTIKDTVARLETKVDILLNGK